MPQGFLVGLLTDRDLLRGYRQDAPAQTPLPSSTPVVELMQTGIVTATDDTELRDIAQAMVNDGVRCIPIVNGDKILGIITATDVLKCVVSGHIGRLALSGLLGFVTFRFLIVSSCSHST